MIPRKGTCKSCKFHGTGRDNDECNNPKSKNYQKFMDLLETGCLDWVDYREGSGAKPQEMTEKPERIKELLTEVDDALDIAQTQLADVEDDLYQLQKRVRKVLKEDK